MHTFVLCALLFLQTGLAPAEKRLRVQAGASAPGGNKNAAGAPAKNDLGPGFEPRQGRTQSLPISTPVPPPTSEEIALQQQIVPDPDRPTAERIVFTAKLNPQNFEDPEEGFTNMEDALPATVELFPNRANIRYAVRGGVFRCDVPVLRDSTNDVAYSFTLKIESRKSKAHYTLKAQGEIPHLQSRWELLGLTGQILFAVVAALFITALVLLVIWYVKGKNREPKVVDSFPEPPIQQPPTHQTYRQPVTDPYGAGAASSRFPQQPDLYRTAEDNSQKIAELERSLTSLLSRPTDDWRRAIGSIGNLQVIPGLVQPRPIQQGGRSGLVLEDQAILAVVNQWINGGATNRQELLNLAGELGQEMKLMQHVNVARLLSDVTALSAVDLAESSTDGGWLYCSSQDGIGMAVPADSRLFQSGLDRTLLQRMFDGVSPGPGELQFARVYRPCRLRITLAPNRFEIVQKGLLQLSGRPSPSVQPPPEFLSLRQPIQSLASTPTSSQTLVSVIREHLETLASRLAGMENAMKGLSARSEAPISASRIPDLEQFVLPSIQRQMQQVEQLLKTSSAPTPPPATPSTTVLNRLGTEVAGMRNLLHGITERLGKVEADSRPTNPRSTEMGIARGQEVAAQLPVIFPVEDQIRVRTESAADPSALPDQLSAPAPTETQTSTAMAKQSAGNSHGLPASWQEVVGGIHAFKGLGERELAESLKRMQIALQQLPGASEIRLVHLMETMGKFRVHDATVSPDGQVLCPTCDGPLTFQVALCVGEDTASELQVLFAAGDYAPYNYPAGYRQLIQSLPNQQFRIQTVLTPAVLTLVAGKSPAEYVVKYKLEWR